jgi:Fe-S-cluster containining protein
MIAMHSSGPGSAKSVKATVDLVIKGRKLRVEITAPKGATNPVSLLPQIQSLADTFVADAVKTAEASGRRISCRKGCGACCRQVVPISEIEAEGLQKLVAQMPQARREIITKRFEQACQRLESIGLLERFLRPEAIRDSEVTGLGLKYFSQGIACPFLENESCSIHPDRPIACREYLVTSPAENCANPKQGQVHCVEMPLKLSKAIRRLGDPEGAPWLPLVLALRQPTGAKPPRFTGTELVEMLFAHLTGKKLAGASERPQPPPSPARRKPWWRFW